MSHAASHVKIMNYSNKIRFAIIRRKQSTAIANCTIFCWYDFYTNTIDNTLGRSCSIKKSPKGGFQHIKCVSNNDTNK